MSPRHLSLTATLTLAALALPTAAAHAATVSTVQGGISGNVLNVAASPGEVNTLTVTYLPAAPGGAKMKVVDTTAPLSAQAPCAADADGSVTCPTPVNVIGRHARLRTTNPDPAPQVINPSATVNLGDGDDSFTFSAAPGITSVVSGGTGADTITGGEGTDRVDPGPGADTVSTGAGIDRVSEGSDDRSADRLNGGGSDDTISFTGRTQPVTANLAAATQSAGSAGENNTIAGFEAIEGGDAGDDITVGISSDSAPEASGGKGDDTLRVKPGDTTADFTLVGDSGNDTITAGRNDDLVIGGSGNDRLTGGAGDDIVDGRAGNDTVDAGAGLDEIAGEGGKDRIQGGAGDDLIDGDGQDGNDTDSGTDGADVIDGGAGADEIEGSAGNDTLIGSAGDDFITGGEDNDLLRGGDGVDTLRGDDGRDRAETLGADKVNTRDGERDTIACGGKGRPRLKFDRGLDVLRGC